MIFIFSFVYLLSFILFPILHFIHTLSLSSFQLNKESYSIGDCVYLSPHTYSFPNVKKTSGTTTNKKQKKEEEEVLQLNLVYHIVVSHEIEM